MSETTNTNAEIWQSEKVVADWAATSGDREAKRASQWRFMGELLPYGSHDRFTFLDLGAGTGAAARTIMALYPNSSAVLADFSAEMLREAEGPLTPFAGRYSLVEFDMLEGRWPEAIPTELGAVVTSLCIHHVPDARKEGLFSEIFERLAPGGWYVNYDPVTSTDPLVEQTWQRVNDREDPEAEHKRHHRSPEEEHRYENHVRYMIPLERQLAFLHEAGFEAIDVYWKQLENVIYAGRRPG